MSHQDAADEAARSRRRTAHARPHEHRIAGLQRPGLRAARAPQAAHAMDSSVRTRNKILVELPVSGFDN